MSGVPAPVLILRAKYVLADVGFKVAADGLHDDWEQKLDAVYELLEQIEEAIR